MICCDTCPYWPTCEEVDDFKREVLGLDDDDEPIDPTEGLAHDYRNRARL